MAEVRVEKWKRNLLDLSLRNRLLNVKDGKHLLPLLCNDIAKLEDSLSANTAIKIETLLAPAESQRRLKEIYRAGRLAIEETGVNSVFVAIGFLDWNKDASEETSYRAPILLVPVRLERQSASSGYRMARLDEETKLNTTLVEFLRAEFGITVPELEPLPEDDSGADVETILTIISNAVAEKGWRVSAEASLGFFSFGKISLWQDLTSNLEAMRRNPLVDHLVSGGQIYDDGIKVFPPNEIATHLDATKLYCPLGADASQLTAILYSELGKSFVLHGPPGTGKSQTITNIIAHNLALGRRVLFVSEKKAALDVVYNRLRSVGLGPFCLELHSTKSGKAQVLSQFAEALAVPLTGVPSGHQGVCTSLMVQRDALAKYVRALHHVYPNGRSAYELLSRAIASHPAASSNLVQGKTLSHTAEEVTALESAFSALAMEWKSVDGNAYQALSPVRISEWTPELEMRVRTAAERMIQVLDQEAPLGLKGRLKRLWTTLMVCRLISFPFFAPATEARKMAEDVLTHLPELRLVSAYKKKRLAVKRKGLEKIIEAMESGAIKTDDAGDVFADAYAAKMLSDLLSSEKALASFSGLSQDELIRSFREADALYLETVKAQLFALLSARLPAGRTMDCPEMSELGVLKRECEKKTRHKPVRQLLSEIKGIASRLKPCFLMSPLSVSQYLTLDLEPFDLVIFDEASQIPVWDAVGVIARGKQVIVVGDPKQMPPTNFFQKGVNASEEEEVETVEDMESILDEALALGMHASFLNWHYRSRHESLIAFSNKRYYKDGLNTFPASVNSERLGVKLHIVADGVYDASSTRTNRHEAAALVDWLFSEAIRDDSHRSFGVVTFSMAQKNLIEDLIEKRRAEHPEVDAFFDESKEDAFFVKNLENVQGDERDVIVFSICYAPDLNGHFAMNFGPLNRQGGERRLNVAVTRAREQVVVFSSIHGSQIDLQRSNAVGVKHLREFLEYAENNGQMSSSDSNRLDAGVMAEVAELLSKHGYSCKAQVGASNRKIDLAVYRGADEGNACGLLGILGDGPEYGSDLTVRDRDSLRVQVLQSLGWNIFRLWSIDWRLNRERTEKRLLETLEMLKKAPNVHLPTPILITNETKIRALRPMPIEEHHVATSNEKRDLEQVPIAELKQLRDEIVKTFGKCPNDVLYREMVRRLGYSVLSQKARKILESRLEMVGDAK